VLCFAIGQIRVFHVSIRARLSRREPGAPLRSLIWPHLRWREREREKERENSTKQEKVIGDDAVMIHHYPYSGLVKNRTVSSPHRLEDDPVARS
jgi:hypothetical protein